MSRRNSRNTAAKKEESSGLGFLGALAVAGGAAAIGFLAKDVWDTYQEVSGNTRAQAHTSQGRQSHGSEQSNRSEWEKQQLRRQTRGPTDNVPDAVRCVICMDNQREIVTDPCGHVSLCLDCGDQVTICPICQARIQSKKLVYVA